MGTSLLGLRNVLLCANRMGEAYRGDGQETPRCKGILQDVLDARREGSGRNAWEERIIMKVIMAGSIADAVSREIMDTLPYVEENVMKAVVGKILPKHGIIVEAARDELKDMEELGTWLYHDIEIKSKEVGA